MAEFPRCPDCSYDLSGTVASWGDAWPTWGVCPECGGELSWGEVLTRRERAPAWSFEHADGATLRLAAVTLARLAEPVGFWNAMRAVREARPWRVLLLLAGVGGAGLALAAALAAGMVREVGPAVGMSMTTWSVLGDSYGGNSREAVIYLVVWLLGSAAGVAPFARRRRGFPGALASVMLYAGVCVSVLWTALAIAAMIDVYQFVVLGVAEGVGEFVAVLGIAAAWVWLLVMWFGAVRRRLPVREALAAWLVSQISAAGAVVAFGAIDVHLPF